MQLVFGSQILHEATMYYPMRSVRDRRWHNSNFSLKIETNYESECPPCPPLY